MNWHVKSFQELTNDELFALMKLRVNIFVVEQACAYSELDDYDRQALHYFAEDDGDIVANVRLLPRDTAFKEPSIGRVVVAPEYRGGGYGRRIMQKAMHYIAGQWHEPVIKLSAQTHLKSFYGELDFRQLSDAYLDSGISHVDMIWEQK
ncbi:GNAT family N-acetyltransferase [Barrientosiimonas marina]|uniref:GNAT family N-acetyltransferase n=1 Tax=Lentibacillus kimchii TaxID=1542911 RepID=A0ABW2UUC0_9BACI